MQSLPRTPIRGSKQSELPETVPPRKGRYNGGMKLADYHDFPGGITAIDTGYVRPRLDASHLLVRRQRAAFVDTGTSHSVSRLMAALERADIDPGDVDYILLTHIHLDHAGGAGALAQLLPNAQVVVHPRGAKHMAEPGKLIEGTKKVYGAGGFQRLYGEIVPIDPARILTVEDGDRLSLGGSTLEFLHTPGHALHHYCIVDHDTQSVFAGDTFGISYRDFDTRHGAFIFPATTPTHFDPDQAHDSIDRILAQYPQAVFLTHYSRVTELERLAEDLHGDLVAFVEIARRCADQSNRLAAIKRMMRAYLGARLDEHEFIDDEGYREYLLEMDIDLNAQGLLVWLDRQKKN